MNVINYPSLLIAVMGLLKVLLTLVISRLIIFLVRKKGLGVTTSLNVSLKEKDNSKATSKTFMFFFSFLLIAIAFMLLNLFASPFGIAYGDPYVVYILSVSSQCIAIITILFFIELALSILYVISKKKLEDKNRATTYILLISTYVFTLLSIIPVAFYLLEMFTANK